MHNAQLTMRGVMVWLCALLLVEAQMPTVFEVLLHAARNLDGLVEGTATANGTPTTLIDSHLGASYAGREDDELNGGCVFLKTNRNTIGGYTTVTDEALGKVTTSRDFYTKLKNAPIKRSSVTIKNSGGSTQTDDGYGSLSQMSVSTATNISMLAGSGPFDLQVGNIVPGSLIVKKTGATPDTLYHDNGKGQLIDQTTGVTWATINYDTGIVTLIAGQPALAALSLADYKYFNYYGTVNYDTGEIHLRFATALTETWTATYQYGYAAFLPLIVQVTDFASSTGLVTFESGAIQLGTSIGDEYGVMPRRYPRWLLFQKLNEVLREIKDYVSTSTTLISAMLNDQISVASTARILRVMAGNADTTDRAWQVITRYTRRGEVIRLMDGAPVDADTIAVETLGEPAQVTSESTAISEWYSAEWLGLETAARCMRWRLQQPGADAALITTLLNDLLRRAKDAKAALTVWRSVSVKWPEYPEN